ncbi:hypothetical protein [Brachyspira innocens]|uniref:hypothetical protein n=1 Tax=Brachyspira innocens TaxID=13264 RepID=UPI0026EFFB36|nr:hypothetical protein [Brachyspira innocens]
MICTINNFICIKKGENSCMFKKTDLKGIHMYKAKIHSSIYLVIRCLDMSPFELEFSTLEEAIECFELIVTELGK